MLITISEICGSLEPPMTRIQCSTLVALAGIEAADYRRGVVGHPARLFEADAIVQAHAQEAARTRKQFATCDWLGHALIDRQLVMVDADAGEIRWSDGTRAEILRQRGYGFISFHGTECAAHRMVWIAANGEIPPAMVINHRNNLHWDNRLANLELTSLGNNVKHYHDQPYLTHHQAVTQLQMLPSEPPRRVPAMATDVDRAGGVFRPSKAC